MLKPTLSGFTGQGLAYIFFTMTGEQARLIASSFDNDTLRRLLKLYWFVRKR